MIRRHHRLRVHVAAQVTPLMILPAHPTASLSVPALASGNQIDDGFCKGFFRSLLIAGTPSSAKISGLDLLVPIRLAAIHCLGGSFLPVDGMPSRILGRRSRSRPAAAKRAANDGGLEGDRWPRNNALTIGRPQN